MGLKILQSIVLLQLTLTLVFPYTCRKLFNGTQPKTYWDFQDYADIQYNYGDPLRYKIGKYIAHGTFGEAHKALDTYTNQSCLLKIFMDNTLEYKILREVYMAEQACNAPNSVKLFDILKSSKSSQPILVYEFVNISNHFLLYPKLTPQEIRNYSYSILSTLAYVHGNNIIHKDIKPGNIAIDDHLKVAKVIDWGLSQFYRPGKKIFPGTTMFAAPEVLFESRDADFALDLWSFGLVFGQMIFRSREYLLHSSKKFQLREIAKVFGSNEMFEYAKQYNLNWTMTGITENYPKVDFRSLRNPVNKHHASKDAVDLLEKLLMYDHKKRITAHEALKHPYFYPLFHNKSAGHHEKHFSHFLTNLLPVTHL